MDKRDFYFELPPELIAQSPAEPRDAARLMQIERHSGQRSHHVFSQLPSLLRQGDLLVVNTTKVLPARLIGHRKGHTGACELLLLRQLQQGAENKSAKDAPQLQGGDLWECLARPGKKLLPGTVLCFGDDSLTAEIMETLPNGGRTVRFWYDTQTLYEKLDQFGKMPLPPYIRSQIVENNAYQTVYAKQPGSAAAPTAGLHFTPELIQQLEEVGVGFAGLVLHVGLGTFRPVKSDRIEDHNMHAEWYSLDAEAAKKINLAKQKGGRVIAVGTTSCRTLEAVARQYGSIQAATGETDIFLYPGSDFLVVDGLITNFHLPESTLIMLVSAFCGRQVTMQAYEEAVQMHYRFFSFGDAMLII